MKFVNDRNFFGIKKNFWKQFGNLVNFGVKIKGKIEGKCEIKFWNFRLKIGSEMDGEEVKKKKSTINPQKVIPMATQKGRDQSSQYEDKWEVIA